MYEKQTVRLNYCGFQVRLKWIQVKLFLKKYA